MSHLLLMLTIPGGRLEAPATFAFTNLQFSTFSRYSSDSMQDDGPDKRQTVVVTGAGRGMGRATAERFLAAGARVHVCEIDAKALAEVLEANPGLQGSLADVGSPPEVERLFQEASEWLGHIDVLVNNVGIAGPRAPIEEIEYEDWDQSMRINLSAMFYCIKQVLPAMKRRRHGVILNISTGSVLTVPQQRLPYNVSKTGVEGLTRSVAREVGPFNIRCNAIRPGMVSTERMRGIVSTIAAEKGITEEEVEADFIRYFSMRSQIQPGEIADMAFFLASDKARHVSGQLIGVDGFVEWEE